MGGEPGEGAGLKSGRKGSVEGALGKRAGEGRGHRAGGSKRQETRNHNIEQTSGMGGGKKRRDLYGVPDGLSGVGGLAHMLHACRCK